MLACRRDWAGQHCRHWRRASALGCKRRCLLQRGCLRSRPLRGRSIQIHPLRGTACSPINCITRTPGAGHARQPRCRTRGSTHRGSGKEITPQLSSRTRAGSAVQHARGRPRGCHPLWVQRPFRCYTRQRSGGHRRTSPFDGRFLHCLSTLPRSPIRGRVYRGVRTTTAEPRRRDRPPASDLLCA